MRPIFPENPSSLQHIIQGMYKRVNCGRNDHRKFLRIFHRNSGFVFIPIMKVWLSLDSIIQWKILFKEWVGFCLINSLKWINKWDYRVFTNFRINHWMRLSISEIHPTHEKQTDRCRTFSNFEWKKSLEVIT